MGFLEWVAETFQFWVGGLCIALIPVWVLYLTRADQTARAHVETARHRWESTSTFEIEFQKAHFQFRLVCSVFIAILVISAMVIVCAHVLVR